MGSVLGMVDNGAAETLHDLRKLAVKALVIPLERSAGQPRILVVVLELIGILMGSVAKQVNGSEDLLGALARADKHGTLAQVHSQLSEVSSAAQSGGIKKQAKHLECRMTETNQATSEYQHQ